MTAFQRYKKYVLTKSVVISVSVALAVSLIFAALLPVIEKQLPNADTDTAIVTEAEYE